MNKTVTKDFISSDKLATLKELRFLLLAVLGQKEPMAVEELNEACKHWSLNFTYSFENTLLFLKTITVVKVNRSKVVSRNPEHSFDAISADQELGVCIMQNTLVYLESKGLLQKIFSEQTITADPKMNCLIIHADRLPAEYPFIKSLLLNLEIARPGESNKDKLLVNTVYNTFFMENILVKTLKPESLKGFSEGDNAPIKTDRKQRFFISYDPKDENYRSELEKSFSGQVLIKKIEIWDASKLLPGDKREEKIKLELERADVILFLVSQNLIASAYIHTVEMKRAMELHNSKQVRIVPVIVEHCDFRTLPISIFQPFPMEDKPISDWENKSKAYINIVEQVKGILN